MKPKKHGAFHQKHSLGQNFIEDEALLNRLADLSLMTKEDCALEIGPGFGALTKPLADRAKQVVCSITVISFYLSPEKAGKACEICLHCSTKKDRKQEKPF